MILPIFAAIAVFFVIAERGYAVRPQSVVRRGFFTDVLYAPVHFFMRVFVNQTIAVGLLDVGRRVLAPHSIGLLSGQPVWVQGVGILLVLDFLFYGLHRLKHRWTWWWRLHETHHSSMDLDWLSSSRFHLVEKALDRTIYLLPLMVLGESNGAVLIWASVDAFFGMFNHANLNWRLGPLVYIFNSPQMHRWHHSRDPERRLCNFGNNLSIFDWLFGTAYLADDEPAAFGVDDPNYPEGNIVEQFFYAFRPLSAGAAELLKPSVAS